MRIEDQESAKYVVIAHHDEYERTVSYFVGLDAAREKVKYWKERDVEVYLAQLVETA